MAQEKLVSKQVTRPRRKPDSTVKGKVNRWEGSDYIEFVPAGTRESNRTLYKQMGPSSFYKSEGMKESSYSIHVNVDGNSDDPVADAREIFDLLTADMRKLNPQLPQGSQGRMLLDDGCCLKIWLDSANHQVSILTTLDCSADIERQLLQAQAQMNVAIGRHRTEIINHIKEEEGL